MKVLLSRIEHRDSERADFGEIECRILETIGLGEVLRRVDGDACIDNYELQKKIIIALECLHTQHFSYEDVSEENLIKWKRRIHDTILRFLSNLLWNDRPVIVLSYTDEELGYLQKGEA